MRLRRNNVLLACALLAAFTLAAVIEQQHATPPAPSVLPTRSSADVHGGGYAAFAELLRREGVSVGTFDRRPAQLDDDVDTLIAAYALPIAGDDAASVRTDADLDDLRAWVARGGRLVVLGADRRVAPRERAVLGRPDVTEATRFGAPFTGPLAPGITDLISLNRARFVASQPDQRVELADAGGPLVVDVAIGRGVVRYVNDTLPFANNVLAGGDDARLAFAVGRPRRPGGQVLFDESLHGALVEATWWSIMPVWLRVMLGGIVATVLLLLGGSALRLGPPFVPSRPEPTTAAFLDAVTALYARARTHPEAG